MFKKLLLLTLLMLILSPLVAKAELQYKPYGENEFPIWTMELRRAECIFLGSMVLTYPVASLFYGILVNEGIIIKPEDRFDEMLHKASIASALSFTITSADYILGKREK